jgi:hypothetical protein
MLRTGERIQNSGTEDRAQGHRTEFKGRGKSSCAEDRVQGHKTEFKVRGQSSYAEDRLTGRVESSRTEDRFTIKARAQSSRSQDGVYM